MRVAKLQEFKGILKKRPAIAGLVTGDPFWVPVIPFDGAQFGKCLENVEEWCRRNGGQSFCVWDLTVNDDELLEMEAHAIHRSIDGIFVDVTPCGANFKVTKRLVIAGRFEPKIPLPRNYLVTLKKDNYNNRLVENYINAMHEIYAKHRQVGIFSLSLLEVEKSCLEYPALKPDILYQLVYSKFTGTI